MENLPEIARGVVAIVFTFAVAILVHELGHFIFAKLFGVNVETFSIGFGRALWSRKVGETTYQIAVFPFGGYVKMRGLLSREVEDFLNEEDKPDEKADAPKSGDAGQAGTSAPADTAAKQTLSESVFEEQDALRAKPFWQKFLIFAAGCINNLLTAVLVYFLLAWIGHAIPAPVKPEVEKILPVASKASGLKAGDLIVAVDGVNVANEGKFRTRLYGRLVDEKRESIPVDVLRDGTTVPLTFPAFVAPDQIGSPDKVVEVAGKTVNKPEEAADAAAYWADTSDTVEVVFEHGKERRIAQVSPAAAAGRYWFDVATAFKAPAYVGMPLPNLPAEKAGVRNNDTITAIDGKRVETRLQATELIRARAGTTITMELSRPLAGAAGGTTTVLAIVGVRSDPDNRGPRGQIGVVWATPLTARQQLGFTAALTDAFVHTFERSVSYLAALRDLFTKSFQTIRENVGGPIMIGVMVNKAAQRGAVWFFELFALFNIILAITNLLPLPILDGGHILFAAIETITRRPLPAKLMVGIYNVFLVLLIGLAILITFNDVIMNAWRVL